RLLDILRDVLQPLDRLANLPAHLGQLLRPEQQEGHDQDDQNLRDTKAKHGRITLTLTRLLPCRHATRSVGSSRTHARLSLRNLLRFRFVDCLLESFDGFSEAFTQLGKDRKSTRLNSSH